MHNHHSQFQFESASSPIEALGSEPLSSTWSGLDMSVLGHPPVPSHHQQPQLVPVSEPTLPMADQRKAWSGPEFHNGFSDAQTAYCSPPSDSVRLSATSATKRRVTLALPSVSDTSDLSPLSGSTNSTASRSPHSAVSPASSQIRWHSPHGLLSPAPSAWSRVPLTGAYGATHRHTAAIANAPESPTFAAPDCSHSVPSFHARVPSFVAPSGPAQSSVASPHPPSLSPGFCTQSSGQTAGLARAPFGMGYQRPPPLAVQQMLQLQQQIQQQLQHQQQQLQRQQASVPQPIAGPPQSIQPRQQWTELPLPTSPTRQQDSLPLQRLQLHQLQLKAFGASGILHSEPSNLLASGQSAPQLFSSDTASWHDPRMDFGRGSPQLHEYSQLGDPSALSSNHNLAAYPYAADRGLAIGRGDCLPTPSAPNADPALLEFLQGCPAAGTSAQCERASLPRYCALDRSPLPGASPLFDGLQVGESPSSSGLTPLFGPAFCPLRSPPALTQRLNTQGVSAPDPAPSVPPSPSFTQRGHSGPVSGSVPSVFCFPRPPAARLQLPLSEPASLYSLPQAPPTPASSHSSLLSPVFESGPSDSQPNPLLATPTIAQKRKRSVSAEQPSRKSHDSSPRIGAYTREERRRRIELYRAKRSKRNFTKRVTYMSRKSFADRRPRTGGRFSKLPRPSPIVCPDSSGASCSYSSSPSASSIVAAADPPAILPYAAPIDGPGDVAPCPPVIGGTPTPTDDLDSLFAFDSVSPSPLNAPSRASSLPDPPVLSVTRSPAVPAVPQSEPTPNLL